MLQYKEYSKLLKEGFVIKNKTLFFDPNAGSFIKTSFGKSKKRKPYIKTIDNGTVYSVYGEIKKINKKTKDEILRTIKGQSDVYELDYDSYKKFLTRTAIYMASLIKKNEADVIFVMDSSSPLVKDLQTEINKRLPKYYDTHTYYKKIFKNPDFSQINIDPGDANLKDINLKTMKSTFNKLKKTGNFKISKFFGGRRKFVKNWLKLNDNILHKVIDSNVVVIDDFLTSGSTMTEAARLLTEAGAKSVIGLTIAKET